MCVQRGYNPLTPLGCILFTYFGPDLSLTTTISLRFHLYCPFEIFIHTCLTNKSAKIATWNLREFQSFKKQISQYLFAEAKELNSHWSRIFGILLNKSSIKDFTGQLKLIKILVSAFIDKEYDWCLPLCEICYSTKWKAKFALVNCVTLMSKLWCFVSNKIIAIGIFRDVTFPRFNFYRQNVYFCVKTLAIAPWFISSSTVPH